MSVASINELPPTLNRSSPSQSIKLVHENYNSKFSQTPHLPLFAVHILVNVQSS